MFALRCWILNKSTAAEKYGPGNFFFVCVEALLREHLAITPRRITLDFDPRNGRIHPLLNGYTHWERWYGSDPRTLWHALQNQVDNGRMILRQLPAFLEDNFDFKEHSLQSNFQAIRSVFERYVEEWETAELRLRTYIDDVSSLKTTEMAERSIAESKRVILRKFNIHALEVISVFSYRIGPAHVSHLCSNGLCIHFSTALSRSIDIWNGEISAASLNNNDFSSLNLQDVQQINGSGHSITAFVGTAIALLASTLFSWGSVTLFVAYRNHRVSEWAQFLQSRTNMFGHDDGRDRRGLVEKLLFISK